MNLNPFTMFRSKAITSSQPVISHTLGNQMIRGALWSPDNYRRPTALQLIQRYGRWVQLCTSINGQVAASVKPRLFTIGSKSVVEKMAKLRPRALDARTKAFLTGRMEVKPGAVASKRLVGNIDDMTEILDHDALRLLDAINPWDDGFSFREMWYSDLQWAGRLFSQIVTTNSVPTELWRMLPQYTEVIPHPKDFVECFRYGRSTPKKDFKPDEVFWVRMPDPSDPWGGMGTVEAWLQSIDADYAMVAFQDWLFQRGGSPDYVMTSEAGFTEQQMARIRVDWRNMFGRQYNRQESLAFMGGKGATLEKLGQSPKEMEYSQSRKDARDEICTAFGVPKSLITSDDVNRANATEGRRQHMANKIWPMIMRMEDAINQRLLPMWSDKLVIIHENPLAEDQEIRVQVRKSKLESGYSINELRIEDGEEPLDDPQADQPMVSSAIVPLSMAGQMSIGGMGVPGSPSGSTEVGADWKPATPDGSAPNTAAQAAQTAGATEGQLLEQPEGQSAAVATNDLRQTVGGSAAILAIQQAYWGRKLPRDAAMANAMLVFGFSEQEAEKLFPEIPPDAPKSEEEIAQEEAAREALANGTMGANAGGNGNPDAPDDGGKQPRRGGGDSAGRAGKARANRGHSGSGVLQGEAKAGLGELPGVCTHHSESCHGHDSTSAMIFKSWETGEGIDTKALDDPQSGIQDAALLAFAASMSEVFRKQFDAMVVELTRQGITANQAVVEALKVLVLPQYAEAIAASARPFMEQAVEAGGQFGIRRLRGITTLPPAVGFDVSNPEVQRFIDNYSARLANGVNQYTAVRARELLGEGLANGESIPQLTARVQEWAGTVGDAQRGIEYRAANIARTESARAYVAGQEEAWKQTGVVTSKRWLKAPDACDFCSAIAEQFNNKAVGLGQAFLPQGATLTTKSGDTMNLDYSDTMGPPLHPQCRCDLIPILEDE